MLAFFYDKFTEWTYGRDPEKVLTRDEILDATMERTIPLTLQSDESIEICADTGTPSGRHRL